MTATSGVLGAIASVMGNQQGYNSATQAQAGKSADAGAAIERATIEQGAQQKVLDEQKAKAELQTQSVISNLGEVLGADPTKQNYVKAAWATAFRDETNKALVKGQELAQLESTSFLENPLTWLGNQFKADSVEAELGAHKDAAAIAGASLSKLDALQVSGAEAAAKTAVTITEATQAAKLKLGALQATIASAEITQKNAATNIQNIHAMAAGDARTIDLAKTAYDVHKSEEELVLSRQAHTDAHQAHMDERLLRAEALTAARNQNSVFAENQQFKRDKAAADEVKGQIAKNRLEFSTAQLEYNKQKLEFAKEQEPAKREALKAKLEIMQADLEKKHFTNQHLEEDYARKNDMLDKKSEGMDLDNIRKQMTIDAKNQEKEAKVHEIATVALGLSSLGYANEAEQVNKMQANPHEWDAFKAMKFSGMVGKDLQDKLINAAYTASDPKGTRTANAGVNPADALATYATLGQATTLPDQASKYLVWLRSQRDAALTATSVKGIAQAGQLTQEQIHAMKPFERDALVNDRIKQQTDAWSGNAEMGGSYLVAPPLVEFKGNKLVTDTPLWKHILSGLAEAGSGKSDYRTISDMAMQAVKAKTISFEDAVKSISTIYSQAILMNNTNTQFDRFATPTQKNYMVDVSNSFIGSSSTWLNPTPDMPGAKRTTGFPFKTTDTYKVDASRPEEVRKDLLIRLGASYAGQ